MEVISFVALVLVLVLVFYASKNKTPAINKPEQPTKKVINFTFKFPIDPQQIRELHDTLREAKAFEALCAVRLVEIIFDSLYITKTSKNLETAKSRLDLAADKYMELRVDYPDMAEQIMMEYAKWKDEAVNLMYINSANNFIEKSKSVKTQKTKDKYIQSAISILEEGLLDDTDKEMLTQEIEKIKMMD